MSAANFEILDAADPSQRQRWETHWHSWTQREVFAHPGYVALYSGLGTEALCAVLQCEEGSVMYPFLLRDLTVEPYWSEDLGTIADLVNAYGYGGPFAWDCRDRQSLASRFWPLFDAWARERGVVSEFLRFTLFDDTIIAYPGERELKLQNVVRLLDLDEETMYMDFEHKVRKNVKKAQRSGVVIEVDPEGRRLDDFMRIYGETMDRREANQSYYFPRAYFESIHRDLPGQFTYFHAVHEGEVVSTEIVLVSAENVYSFLGGTAEAAFHLRPNDLLKYEIIRWARAQGKLRLVLGGGYQPDDGIYRYKVSFAPRCALPFHVGHRVLDQNLYDHLLANKQAAAVARGDEWTPHPGFFPAYRA